ncbi:acyl-CoA dehydrogenase family protein [Streptantibioticus rubrisoli]|uniref:Acyl-CoA dehydrogenase family protein n=1 Tax=Streptantibioticus rubrisoli TaxID=1387313 RepID=A0ABT1PAE3_9ACTN|nr:acyl-CoA dehydrogenase family protein [Streptantibioticus rubrisoli]MCQ4042339.1 acyl-CoA dehydrogenase family protein [Streptantibioticus rubrisoli]
MRLAPTADEELFARTVRAVLERRCAPREVRAGFARGRWAELAEIGVTGLLVPEEHGGLGLGAGALVAVAEEAGRACAPEPVVEAAVAATLLARVDADGRAREWLRALAVGAAVPAVRLAGPGTAPVAHAAHANFVLVADGDTLYGRSAAEAYIHPAPGVDPGRGLAYVDMSMSPDGLLAVRQEQAVTRAARLGAIGAAADLLGAARAMLDLTVRHARQRHQFGRPIGSYQAVKHQLADVLSAVEFAHPVVLRAAYSHEHGRPSAGRDAAMAKVFASDAADLAARSCLQVHGAIGYTQECDLVLWLRRVWALSAAWGDAAHHRAAIAADLLGPAPAPPCP